MNKNLFVANWKMNKSFSTSLDFCSDNKQALKHLSTLPHTEIILCPSFPALFSIAEILSDTMVSIGAQTCSSHEKGPYTGQVNALTLKEVGCDYCIVGHSEQRSYTAMTNEDIAKQIAHLLAVEIHPIICVGETKKQFEHKETFTILEQQLYPIMVTLKTFNKPFTIAYEPIWSIGTGIIPQPNYLNQIFSWLTKTLQNAQLSNSWYLIYGGSVSPETAKALKTIQHLNGFLIGDASLDFQKFEKIVSSGN